GPYEAAGVWAVLDGTGTIRVDTLPGTPHGAHPEGHTQRAHGRQASGERTLTVDHPGAYMLVEHERHTAGVLALEVGDGVECLATCFTPGVT
ncbi:MAG TPA: hypothetical protein VN845_02710, partial [Solirubrobacteraceae bacterium]|nr:hypothetical protein [Solirubrobacteraceae bacterium]